jgi:NADPH2:quinone reductase
MAVPQTQRALLITEIGQPLTLVTDRPVLQPGPNQVQIKVTIAGPNPHDQLSRDIGLFVEEFLPVAITNDVVGIVTALGSDVTGFAVGDQVFGQANFEKGGPQNGTQEYAVLDSDFTAKIPQGISADEAATLPTNSATSVISLFDEVNLGIPAPWTSEAANFDYKTKWILIVGGGTSCGKFGVQLASLVGLGQIVVVGGPETELKSYGATHVLDRHLPYEELLGKIREIVGDDLLYAYDTANPPEGQILAINALSSTKRGRFARLLPIGPVDETKVDPKKEGFELCEIHGSCHGHPALSKAYWERLPGLLLEGKIKPGRYEVAHGLDVDKFNALLDKYRDYLPVVKTHFHI